MNCFEKLRRYHKEECEPCIWNGKIIEFSELPETEKPHFDSYDEDRDLIVYCKKCNYYKHLNTDENEH